jgi:O-antigen biosynthesis protein WbqP
MPKFRTMWVDTPQVASHMLASPEKWFTPVGSLLRRTSLDMSFVGPRPALYNQHDLIALRTERGVHELVPGITGWAQINGRDECPIPIKVELDEYYLKHRSFFFDVEILWLTFWKVLRREGTAVPAAVQGADSPDAMAKSLLESGKAWCANRDFRLALCDFDQAIRLAPTAASFHCRGQARAMKGDYQAAIDDFNDAINREPSLAEAYFDLARAWDALGDAEQAKANYGKAAELDSQFRNRSEHCSAPTAQSL